MNYYKEVYINPKLVYLIKEHTLTYFKELIVDRSYNSHDCNFPKELEDLINNEFKSYGVPEMKLAWLFRRRDFSELGEALHVDKRRDGYVTKCALNIPIEGTEGTIHYWAGGEYTEENRVLPTGFDYTVLNWKNGFTILDQVELVKPTLVRTDIPHMATNVGSNYRSIVSIRFKEEPSFEELANKFVQAP